MQRRKFLKVAFSGPFFFGSVFGLGYGAFMPHVRAELTKKDGELIETWLNAAKVVGDRTAIGTLLLSRFVERVYFLMKPIAWKPSPLQNQSLPRVNVPIGFITDFASVPRPFWSALPPDGEYTYAAIIHDFLYWNQATDKPTADLVLKAAMEDFGVPKAEALLVYNGVRAGGQSAWDNNAALKKAGEKRILKVFPTDPVTRWEDWKRQPGVFQ